MGRRRSDRNYIVAVVLVWLLGFLGAHRFYAGKGFTGFLQLITLGGFGIWWIVDIIWVTAGGFTDASDGVIRWGTEGL